MDSYGLAWFEHRSLSWAAGQRKIGKAFQSGIFLVLKDSSSRLVLLEQGESMALVSTQQIYNSAGLSVFHGHHNVQL